MRVYKEDLLQILNVMLCRDEEDASEYSHVSKQIINNLLKVVKKHPQDIIWTGDLETTKKRAEAVRIALLNGYFRIPPDDNVSRSVEINERGDIIKGEYNCSSIEKKNGGKKVIKIGKTRIIIITSVIIGSGIFLFL